MGTIVARNQPCLDPTCGSSDARQVYEDGSSFCFSCRKRFGKNETNSGVSDLMKAAMAEDDDGFKVVSTTTVAETHKASSKVSIDEIMGLPMKGFKERNITRRVCEHYGVRSEFNEDGIITRHFYPYGDVQNGKGGFKIRTVATKDFAFVGKFGGLFGKELFNGGGKRLVITEGEIDALSVAEANITKYQKFYPCVSVPSASSLKPLIENRDWIRSFQEVVLLMDNDEAGQVALKECIKIIGVDKVRIVKYPEGCKDASDVLVKHGGDALLQMIWDAAVHQPAGIMRRDQLKQAMHEQNNIVAFPYPPCLQGMNSKLKGMRDGEISLFISGTGSGKSTMMREIAIWILEQSEALTGQKEMVGIISLEEQPGETTRNMSAMAIMQNPANEEIALEELDKGFDKVFGDDRVIVLDHQGSIKDGSILDQLEYMALMGCKKFILDHVTILVSEGADNLSGNEAIDKIMNDLLRFVKKHGVWLGLVSHLRKAPSGGKAFEEGRLPSIDDIRGSGSIKQVSMDIISFARNMAAESERERNTILMCVLKCRRTGQTGPVPGAYFNGQTGRLEYIDSRPDETFEIIS